MSKDKVEWYTRGYESFGWRVRFAVWLVKIFYKLRLISEEDVKMYVNSVIEAWFIDQARKRGLKVATVQLDDTE